MKKRVLGLLFILCLSISACESQQSINEENKTDEVQEQEKEPEADNEEKEDTEEDTKEDEITDEEKIKVNIYFTDQDSEELDSEEASIDSLDAQLVWKELQRLNVVTAEAQVLGIEVNETDKSIVLDLNQKFGEQLRSVGTTEEGEIMKALTYTYLDAYQCDKILFQEEGNILESSHKEYDQYLDRN